MRRAEDHTIASSHIGTCFDELQLVLYTPKTVFIFRHDLCSGVSKAGKSTTVSGYNIQLYGPQGEEDWQKALAVILEKLDRSACERLVSIDLDDPRIAAAAFAAHPDNTTSFHYHGAPLSALSPSRRGKVLETLVRREDRKSVRRTAS